MQGGPQSGEERRAAARHRVPGSAEVYWEGCAGAQLSVSDVSASGCLLRGAKLPEVGTQVVIALALADLPSFRLRGVVARILPDGAGGQAAVRFLLPARCLPGVSRLLETEAREVRG